MTSLFDVANIIKSILAEYNIISDTVTLNGSCVSFNVNVDQNPVQLFLSHDSINQKIMAKFIFDNQSKKKLKRHSIIDLIPFIIYHSINNQI